MSTFDDIERARERNEGVHPREDRYDETGSFTVRVVFLDGVDRSHKTGISSLRFALDEADRFRAELHGKGYSRSSVHVGVIDENDPERGELDWDEVS